jgi:hypothetical protein
MISVRQVVFALTFWGVAAAAPAGAQPAVNWVGGPGGSWNLASNWDTNGIPDGSFNVTIGGPASATVTLDSSVSVNQLSMSGTNLLFGTGQGLTLTQGLSLQNNATITLGSGSYIAGGSPAAPAVLMLTGGTIQGQGGIGTGGYLVLVNQAGGMVDANVGGQMLTLNNAAGGPTPASNAGTLRASGGGTLVILGGAVNNAGGIIAALDASAVQFTTTIQGGTLSTTGSGVILWLGQLDGTTTPVTNAGSLQARGGTVKGTLNNNGAVTFGTNSGLTPAGDTTLTGSGTLTLAAGNFIAGGGSAATPTVLTSNSTIRGNGAIGTSGYLVLVNQAGGLVDANVSGLTLTLNNAAGGPTAAGNAGILQASGGGTLVIQGRAVNNVGGTIRALNNSTVQFTNAVQGGTLSSSGSGVVLWYGQIDGTTTPVTNGGVLQNRGGMLLGTLNNTGSVTFAANTAFTLAGDTTLTGTGTLTLAAGNSIAGGPSATAARTLTNASTIQGAGAIGSTGFMVLANQAAGVVDANSGGNVLTLDFGVAGGTNLGTLRSGNGGTLVITDLPLNNAGGTIAALDGGTTRFTNTIQGGTLSTSGSGVMLWLGQIDGTASPVTNVGTLQSRGGTLKGTLNNTGVITSATGYGFTLTGDATLTGSGTVNLAVGNSITGGSPASMLTNASTIQGAGNVGVSGLLILANQAAGLVDANVAGSTLTLNYGVAGGTNRGTLRSSNGGTLVILGQPLDNLGGAVAALNNSTTQFTNTIQGGTFATAGSGVVQWGGQIDGTAHAVSNTGSLQVTGTGGTIKGALNNTGAITFAASAGFTLAGDVTLTGSGTFTLGINNTVAGGPSPSTAPTLSNASTIRGAGNLGVAGNMILVNQAGGLIDATVAGSTLLIEPVGASGNAGTMRGNGGPLSLIVFGTFTNNGTFRAQAGGSFDVSSLTNLTGNTLTGGAYESAGTGSILKLPGTVTTNAASILLDGGGQILNRGTSAGALTPFATNAAGGSFTTQNGANFTTAAALNNAGKVRINTATTLTVSGTYTQAGGLTQVTDAASVLIVTAGFNLSGGTLQGSGTVTAGTITSGAATVMPGVPEAAGKLTVAGNLTLVSSSTTAIRVGGTAQGTTYDFLHVTGATNLGNATLHVTLINGSQGQLHPSDTFTILTADGGLGGGTFGGLPDGALFTTTDGLGNFQIHYTGTDVILINFQPVPEPTGLLLIAGCVAGAGGAVVRRRSWVRGPSSEESHPCSES